MSKMALLFYPTEIVIFFQRQWQQQASRAYILDTPNSPIAALLMDLLNKVTKNMCENWCCCDNCHISLPSAEKS